MVFCSLNLTSEHVHIKLIISTRNYWVYILNHKEVFTNDSNAHTNNATCRHLESALSTYEKTQ